MRLKYRLDYAWEMVLKHKAHYFGGFITFIVMAILSIAFRSPVSASITIVGYLTYSVCLDLYVLADEGFLRRHKWGRTVGTTEPQEEEPTEEPVEEDPQFKEDEHHWTCGDDCDFCEEECDCCDDSIEEGEDEPTEEDEYMGEEL